MLWYHFIVRVGVTPQVTISCPRLKMRKSCYCDWVTPLTLTLAAGRVSASLILSAKLGALRTPARSSSWCWWWYTSR